VLWTELDDLCDTLVVERRSSEVLSTQSADDGPVYHALSVQLSFDTPKQNFISPDIWTNFDSEVPLFFKITQWKEAPVPKSSLISRAKLVARFDDRYAVAKFSKSSVWSKVPEGSTLIFEVPEFPYNTV